MRFSFKLGSLVAVLLHEDFLPSSSGHLTATAAHEMRAAAEFFFDKVGLFQSIGAIGKDLSLIRDKLDAACSKSHLRYSFAIKESALAGAKVTRPEWPLAGRSVQKLAYLVTYITFV